MSAFAMFGVKGELLQISTPITTKVKAEDLAGRRRELLAALAAEIPFLQHWTVRVLSVPPDAVRTAMAYCAPCRSAIESGEMMPILPHVIPVKPNAVNPCCRCGARRFDGGASRPKGGDAVTQFCECTSCDCQHLVDHDGPESIEGLGCADCANEEHYNSTVTTRWHTGILYSKRR